MAAETAASLPYHEPGIVTILVQTSFLLLLNIINAALDRVVYCGLLGQVLIGIAWGTPGAKWLSTRVEEVVVQLGYLGLILLVFEGGLSTSFKSLKANLLLSSAVALTGISVPIALSFSLQGLLGATPVQAFAAGAALCSTSLGTTFTVLASSGLSTSRLGVVLTSAAMMDDVVGLVMVQVISNLGADNFTAATIVRPILVSLAFAILAPLACRFVVKPVTLSLNKYREAHPSAKFGKIFDLSHTPFLLHTLLLIGLVTGATYVGTSNLFAAYIAGATISWWDTEVPHPPGRASVTRRNSAEKKTDECDATSTGGGLMDQNPTSGSGDGVQSPTRTVITQTMPLQANLDLSTASIQVSSTYGSAIYERYYQQPVTKILQPFFFASIGFSIPITRMFRAEIVWRGIVYTILMTFGKLVCGLWLVRFSLGLARESPRGTLSKVRLLLPSMPHMWGKSTSRTPTTPVNPTQSGRDANRNEQTSTGTTPRLPSQSSSPPKPFSLQPPLIMALAMTARGEIGFLISAVAESRGVFSSASDSSRSESDIFLVVTWAIFLCTIIGPLGVGLCVRRVKILEERKNREQEGAGRDVLGVWGVR